MKQLNYLFFLMLMGTIIISSCSKEDEIMKDQSELTEQVISQRVHVNLDHPVVLNGAYSFRDSTHFVTYLNDLQNLYDTDYEQFTYEVSQDLDNPDSRDISLITVFQRMSNDEFIDPNDRYMTYLVDPIITSIVNLDHELIVDGNLFTYVNNTQIFLSDPSNTTTRDAIRNLRNNSTQMAREKFSSSDVPDGVTWAEDDDIKSLILGSCGCTIKIEKVDCNTVRIFGSCKDLLWGDGDGEITISFFENGSPFTKTQKHTISGNFEFFFDISSFGSDVIFDVSANPDCLFGKTAHDFLAVSPNTAICDSEDRFEDWGWKQDNGSQAISFRTSYSKNFWAGYEQAHLFSYWFNGSVWKNVKARRLTVSIDATRKTLGCSVLNNEFETKTCTNCKSKKASVNGLHNWHCDGDVVGTFRRNMSSWTITATQSVDFDCCE